MYSRFVSHEFVSLRVFYCIYIKHKAENFFSFASKLTLFRMHVYSLNDLVLVGAFGFNNVTILKAELLNDLTVIFVSNFNTRR
jgi:hypothetical protein